MKKPADAEFCCGIRYPTPQCDDCPMREWDFASVKEIRFVGSSRDGYWVEGYWTPSGRMASRYEDLL